MIYFIIRKMSHARQGHTVKSAPVSILGVYPDIFNVLEYKEKSCSLIIKLM